MIKSNLINVLKTFTVKELKQFREFVSSPFYNTNENVVILFDILRKYYPDFEGKGLDKKKIFSKIYSDEKYKDSKLRLLIFYLYDLAEKFLINNNFSNDEIACKVFLLNEFKKRNLSDNFEKTLSESYKKLINEKAEDSRYLINKYNIDIHNLNYFKEFSSNKYKGENRDNNAEEIFMSITNLYRLVAFEMYEVVLTNNYLYNKSFNSDIFEKIINEFDKRKFSTCPEILCRYYLCMMWRNPGDEANYYELKELLELNREYISAEALNASYIGLKNFCNKELMKGDRKFLRELFELHKKDLGNKFYLEEGFMSHMFYRNSVVLGTALEEFDWTRDFIEKFREELREKIKHAVYFYSLAFIDTAQNNFETALKHLTKIKTDDIHLKIDVRILQCRLFFELGWQEQLNSLVDASKHFLTNDKILQQAQKEFYSAFLKYIFRISQYRNIKNEHKLELLKSEIENNSNLYGKEWLLRKITEFEKQKGAV